MIKTDLASLFWSCLRRSLKIVALDSQVAFQSHFKKQFCNIIFSADIFNILNPFFYFI